MELALGVVWGSLSLFWQVLLISSAIGLLFAVVSARGGRDVGSAAALAALISVGVDFVLGSCRLLSWDGGVPPGQEGWGSLMRVFGLMALLPMALVHSGVVFHLALWAAAKWALPPPPPSPRMER